MATDNYEEKRKFTRMNVEAEVLYTIKGKTAITYRGISKDLSATGLYLISDFAPSIGDDIEITMTPSNERLPPFTGEGKVIRVDADDTDKNKFHISIELYKTS